MAGVGPSGPVERGRISGDEDTSKQLNGLSVEVGEGVEQFDPDPSDFVSASSARFLSMGTMSRSHSSSRWEGHLRTEDLRRKTLCGEER